MFLLLLIAADLTFIFQYFAWRYIPLFNQPLLKISRGWGANEIYNLNQNLFAITKDWSYPEVYQYTKLFWIVVLTLFVYFKTKEVGYVAWASLFGYLLCDDSLQIHEKVGSKIAESLNFEPILGLRLQEYGEVLVSAIAGIVLLTFIAFHYWRGSSSFRRASQNLLFLTVLIAFFGIVVDLFHTAVNLGTEVSILLGVIEDGGEMIATSLLAGYAFLLASRPGFVGASFAEIAGKVLPRRLRRDLFR